MSTRAAKSSDERGDPRAGWFGNSVIGCVIGIAAVLVLAPFGVFLARHDAHPSSPENQPSWSLLLETVGWCGLIGITATCLAIPAAWSFRVGGTRARAFAMVPLLLPSYFVYSAMNLLRAPHTWFGDLVELSAQHGWKGLPVVLGRMMAVCGLAFWIWPLALIVMAPAFEAVTGEVADSLSLDCASRARRFLEALRMCAKGLVGAAVMVGIVMMGSAVPLHLAQVRTFAMGVWAELILRPGDTGVWVMAWPVMVIAFCAAAVIAGRVLAEPAESGEGAASQVVGRRRGALWGAGAVWMVSAVGPLLLYGTTIEDRRSFSRFIAVGADSIGVSLAVAAGVLGAGMAIGLAFWCGLSLARERGARVSSLVIKASAGLMLCAALMPGVLLGSAWLSLGQVVPDLGDSTGIVVLAHLSRFGCIPALIGCRLALLEPVEQLRLRRIDGATGIGGWWRVCAGRGLPGLVGASIAAACFSLHEIESSVMVQPPGSPSLAQLLLGYLHFSKTEEMSVATVLLVGSGLIAAGAASVLTHGWLGKSGYTHAGVQPER